MRAAGTFKGRNVEVELDRGEYIYADFDADVTGDYENDPPVMYDSNGTGYPGDVGYEIEDIDIGKPEIDWVDAGGPQGDEMEEIDRKLRDYVESHYDEIEWEVL